MVASQIKSPEADRLSTSRFDDDNWRHVKIDPSGDCVIAPQAFSRTNDPA
jgi:hypothetical protein